MTDLIPPPSQAAGTERSWRDVLTISDLSFLRGCPRTLFYAGGKRTGCSRTRERTANTAARLQRLGLVRIVPNPGAIPDKVARVTLTEAGAAALKQASGP